MGVIGDTVGQFEAFFTFNEWWQDFTPTVQFSKGGKTFDCLLTDGVCTVPQEVMRGSGVFYVSVYALNGTGSRKTANAVAVGYAPSGYRGTGETPDNPAPDKWAQVLAALAGKENLGNKVTSLSNSSNNTQYPSAKCVYDAVQAVTPVLGDCNLWELENGYYILNGKMYISQAEPPDFVEGENMPFFVQKTMIYGTIFTTATGCWGGFDVTLGTCFSTTHYETPDTVTDCGFGVFQLANLVQNLSTYSTDAEYPSAKCVYDYAQSLANKTTSLSNTSTDVQYPSAKAVYDAIQAALYVDTEATV